MIPQPYPLWCAEVSRDGKSEVWGGRIIGWIPADGDEHARAVVARVDPDGGTRRTYERPLGTVEVWLGDTQEQAWSAARRAAAGSSPADELDGAMHTVWLEGSWEWVTKKMTTEQREAAVAAVLRYHDQIYADEPLDPSALRW
ncbi:hypothetical protein ACN27G_01030 [Plantactinospora sp. WMMB334]|uniref:hypothetical protein n=1 Tax=Plantactinospora sp. WMMB334 TaxID=3404119 RepID=UPI003B939F0B